MRKINDAGLKLIQQWEGFVDHAYDDFDGPRNRRFIQAGMPVRGTLTIGYGHTKTVKPGMRITKEQGAALLRQDLAGFEKAVERLVTAQLNDNQFAALVAFAFNVGEGAFGRSTLLKKLNAGDYAAVPGELAKFVMSKGNRMQGLVNRRAAEAGLWAKGSFVTSSNVEAKEEKPAVLTKESVSWFAGLLSTLIASVTTPGPIQWAVAGCMVIGFGTGLYLFVSKRL